jgi:phospholipid/cholesterol/gamma-HCH transport system substrate-binding protein
MAAKSNYFKIGLFVVAAFLLIVIGIIVLGASAYFKPTVTWVTYLDETVQGLAVGAPVKLRGVQLGTVSEIALADEKFTIPRDLPLEQRLRFSTFVIVTISITKPELVANFKRRGFERSKKVLQENIDDGWRIRIASSGITGPPFLELIDKGDIMVDITDIPWKKAHEKQIYIAATSSITEQLLTTVDRIAKNLEKTDFAGLVNSTRDMVEKELVPTLRNVDKKISPVLETLDDVSADLKSAMDNINKASKTINNLATIVDKAMETDGVPALHDARKLIANLEKTMEKDVKPLLANASKASEQFPASAEQVALFLKRFNANGSKSLASVNAILAQLEEISGNLRQLTGHAQRYPSHLIFGEPPPPALEKQRNGK